MQSDFTLFEIELYALKSVYCSSYTGEDVSHELGITPYSGELDMNRQLALFSPFCLQLLPMYCLFVVVGSKLLLLSCATDKLNFYSINHIYIYSFEECFVFQNL